MRLGRTHILGCASNLACACSFSDNPSVIVLNIEDVFCHVKEKMPRRTSIPMKEYYTIRTSYSTYYAEVWHQYPNIDKVYFGGKKMCVSFSVYLDEPDPNLDVLGYDERCNTTATLVNGKGTRHMLLCAFAFVRHVYRKKNVSERFHLKDYSTIECNGHEMFLSHLYMLHHGKTWYEAKFGARPLEHQDTYDTNVSAWKSSLKSKPDAKVLFRHVQHPERKTYLINLYERHDTLGDFLKTTKTMDCSIYWKWGDKLVDSVFAQSIVGSEWVIDASILKKPEITVIYVGDTKPIDMFIHTGGAMGKRVLFARKQEEWV